MALKRSGARRRSRNTGPSDKIVTLVTARDFGRCAVCGETVHGYRGEDYSVQHRLRRGNGGTRRPWINLPGNLILACGSATTRCHGRIEDYPLWARERGYAVADGITLPSESPIFHAVHGYVLLNDDGR